VWDVDQLQQEHNLEENQKLFNGEGNQWNGTWKVGEQSIGGAWESSILEGNHSNLPIKFHDILFLEGNGINHLLFLQSTNKFKIFKYYSNLQGL